MMLKKFYSGINSLISMKWFLTFFLFVTFLSGVILFVYSQIQRRVEERGSLVKVGFSTDWEYGSRKKLGHKLTNQAPVELQKVVDYYNNVYRPEIVVAGGDYIESSGVKPLTAMAQLKEINKIFSSLDAPRLYALGNHDMRALSKNDVKEILGITESHAVRDVGAWRLIIVDTNFNKEDDSDRNAKSYTTGYVSKAELKWMDNALATDRPTIVFTHHSPILTRNIDNILEENIINAAEFRSYLEKHTNVVASVAGHTPRPQSYMVNGIYYFVSDTLVNESGLGAFATIDLFYNDFSKRAEIVFEHYGKNRQTYESVSWINFDRKENLEQMIPLFFKELSNKKARN